MTIFKNIYYLFLLFGSPTFIKEPIQEGQRYKIFKKLSAHFYFLRLPFILTIFIWAPYIMISFAPGIINSTFPPLNRVLSALFTLIGLTILSLPFLFVRFIKNDSPGQNVLEDMAKFGAVFTISPTVIELKNTPDACALSVKNLKLLTIRNQDNPAHYQIRNKSFSRGAARISNPIYSEDPLTRLWWSSYSTHFILPPTYNVDIETEGKILTLARGLGRARAYDLVENIKKDALLKLEKLPDNKKIFEAQYAIIT